MGSRRGCLVGSRRGCLVVLYLITGESSSVFSVCICPITVFSCCNPTCVVCTTHTHMHLHTHTCMHLHTHTCTHIKTHNLLGQWSDHRLCIHGGLQSKVRESFASCKRWHKCRFVIVCVCVCVCGGCVWRVISHELYPPKK